MITEKEEYAPWTKADFEAARLQGKTDPDKLGVRVFYSAPQTIDGTGETIDGTGGWCWGYTGRNEDCIPVGDEEGPFETRLGALTAALTELAK